MEEATAEVDVAGVESAGSCRHGISIGGRQQQRRVEAVEASAMVEEAEVEQAGSSKCEVGGMAVAEATGVVAAVACQCCRPGGSNNNSRG